MSHEPLEPKRYPPFSSYRGAFKVMVDAEMERLERMFEDEMRRNEEASDAQQVSELRGAILSRQSAWQQRPHRLRHDAGDRDVLLRPYGLREETP